MRIAQLLVASMLAAMHDDPRHVAPEQGRGFATKRIPKHGTRVYIPGEYRSAGWDDVKAAACRAARRARKQREWIRQGKAYGLKPVKAAQP